jgi:hypothetical protein
MRVGRSGSCVRTTLGGKGESGSGHARLPSSVTS